MTDKAPKKRLARPTDANQLGKLIVDISTGEVEDRHQTAEKQAKDPAAVSLGRRGGLKGGKARAAKLTAEERREIAVKAAKRRWGAKIDKGDAKFKKQD
jgi:hypothetical protein